MAGWVEGDRAPTWKGEGAASNRSQKIINQVRVELVGLMAEQAQQAGVGRTVPSVAEQIAAVPLGEGLNSVPHIAYDLDRPLLRTWLEVNHIEVARMPSLTLPDLRILRSGLSVGLGWTVLPGYLTRTERAEGTLSEIAAPIAAPTNAIYLVWAKSSLGHPRVALARDTLAKALRDSQ